MKYLLDTCVVSELSKRAPDERVVAWFGDVPERNLFVSAVTIGELYKGIEKLSASDAKRQQLEVWCLAVKSVFGDRVLAFDAQTAEDWGRIVGRASASGRTKPSIDMQIAATARHHGMTLVTRNVKDMDGVGVEVVNPFDAT